MKKKLRDCLSKEPYGTKEDAEWDIKRLSYKSKVKLYSYKCSICGKWHLTKKKQNE